MPFPIIAKIAKQIPLKVAFADEDLGSNYGILEINTNGEVTEYLLNDGSIGHSIAIQGNDEEYIDEYFSEDCYTDEEIKEYFNTNSREELIDKNKNDYRYAMELMC